MNLYIARTLILLQVTLHKIRLLLFLFFGPPSLVSYFHKIALFCKSSIEGFPFIFMDGSQGQILLYPEAHPKGQIISECLFDF